MKGSRCACGRSGAGLPAWILLHESSARCHLRTSVTTQTPTPATSPPSTEPSTLPREYEAARLAFVDGLCLSRTGRCQTAVSRVAKEHERVVTFSDPMRPRLRRVKRPRGVDRALRNGSPEEREVRVDRERSLEPRPGG